MKIKKLFIIWAVWRFITFITSVIAPLILKYKPSFPHWQGLAASNLPMWIYSWANFDGVHYLTIIDQGYKGIGLIQAFFPLFPIIVKLISIGNLSSIIYGLIISNLFSFILLIFFYKLLRLDFSKKQSFLSIIFLLLSPMSFFLGAFYTESLFITFVLGSFLFARKKQWLISAIFTILATSTRIVGIFLIPALLFELIQQNSKHKLSFNLIKKEWKKILLISSGSLGLIMYMIYLKINFNDPLYFFHVQSEFGAGREESIILYPQVVWRYIKILFTTKPWDLKYFSYIQEFITGIGGFILLMMSYKKVRTSYLIFSSLAFILPTLTGTFSSMPRYTLVSFSIFIYLTIIFKKLPKYIQIFFLSISFLLLIINTVLFIQGYWVS